jgi:hypothetical protein
MRIETIENREAARIKGVNESGSILIARFQSNARCGATGPCPQRRFTSAQWRSDKPSTIPAAFSDRSFKTQDH